MTPEPIMAQHPNHLAVSVSCMVVHSKWVPLDLVKRNKNSEYRVRLEGKAR